MKATKINTNLYKYIPGEDPLALMTMFVKFPQKDIINRIHSILVLPIAKVLPVRVFVYYEGMS